MLYLRNEHKTKASGGGSWRFRHRILQEYFAEKWVEPEQENKK